MFTHSLIAMTLAAGALVAGAATATAAPTAAAGAGQAGSGCHIVSDLYRSGNTIVTDAETVPCQVPIFLALYRNDVLVSKFSGGAAVNILFPCTPVSFSVAWKNSRGDRLTTNCY